MRITGVRRLAATLQTLFDTETARSAARIKQVLEAGEWTPADAA